MKKDLEKQATCAEIKMPHVENSVFTYSGDMYRRLLFDEIAWIEAAGSYCTIHLDDGSVTTGSFPLDRILESYLPHSVFLRIHRSYVINVYKVTKFVGNCAFVGKQMLPVSASFKKDFLSCFNIVYSKRDLKKEASISEENTSH